MHVYISGETITTTPEHPFYVPQKGWISAISLKAGDILVLQSGKYIIVEKIQHEILESPIKVYNFEVEDYHTYYVGNSSVLVHNQCANIVSKGLTATREPKNLVEQLALEQVKSNPQGTQIPNLLLKDSRWPVSKGWVKMQQIVPTSKGDINIHYVYNSKLNLFDDFKLK